MTRKERQAIDNNICEVAMQRAMQELASGGYSVSRLRTCSAHILETEHWCVLRSYNTIIACYDKRTDICYDVLRVVYGYTSTSAQHVAKFHNDCRKSWDSTRFTAR